MDEKTKAEPVDEDVVMQHSYPSPIVENSDGPYYQIAAHREHDASVAHQSEPEMPSGLPDMAEHQPQHQPPQHEHHNLHELQELQEPSTPQQQQQQQQHDARPAVAQVSADDLQLAAQLTQGLTQGMNQSLIMAEAEMAVVQSQVQQEQTVPQEHQNQLPSQPEPNLQQQLEVSLQNHDHEMMQSQNHALQEPNHEHELQNHGHELQVHDGMPHAEQQPAHHFPQNAPSQSHIPPHLSMEHLPNAHVPYQMSDSTPARKRSKVSRACDECRRKKIKCDAQSEASDQPCSNCRRSNSQCLFSRVPQKRGPSKGYIKELADRINTIEGKLNTNVPGGDSMDDSGRRSSSEAFASPGLGDDSRKRPFSNISGDSFTPTTDPNQISGYATEHRQILPYVHPDFRSVGTDNSSDLSLRAIAPAPSFGVSGDAALQSQPDGLMDGVAHNGLPQGSSHQSEQLPEIEDHVFNRYLEVIHPTFPALASTKARVQSLLWQSPFTLQNAFHQAFFAMVRPFLGNATNVHATGNPLIASRLLSQWEAEGGQRSTATDLVRLQTLVMMIIAADCQATPALRGQPRGAALPWKAEVLGKAVGLGYAMRLHLREVEPLDSPELDPNSDDNVALRAWWVLVMLDRWNAIGTATPLLISEHNVVILPGLSHIVGDVVLALIRLSHVLGHIIPLAISPSLDPTTPARAPLISSFTSMAMEMARAQFPIGRTDPILHLTYWHIQLLAELLSPAKRSVKVLEICKKIVNLLARNHEMINPLTHHFLVLGSLAMLGLISGGGSRSWGEQEAEEEGARQEAVKLLTDILEYALSPSPWNTAVRGWVARWFSEKQPLVQQAQQPRQQEQEQEEQEQQQPHKQPQQQQQGEKAEAGDGNENLPGAGLQQLADLASAVEVTKEEPGSQTHADTQTQDLESTSTVNQQQQQQQQKDSVMSTRDLDVLEALRAGYLIYFNDVPQEDNLGIGISVGPPETGVAQDDGSAEVPPAAAVDQAVRMQQV